MENLDFGRLKNILEIIKIANFTLDQNILRRKILDALSKILHIDSSIFILPDENSKFTDFMVRNIDEKYVREYKQYYYRYDPFKLITGVFHENKIVKLEELVDYPSFLCTEYYNDFLRPQKIYYKIIANMGSRGKSRGLIGLFRPEGSQNFSREEMRMILTISPYVTHALDHIEFRKKIKLKDNIFRIVEKNWPIGILILNDSMKLLYMNPKAKEFCENLMGYKFNGDKYGPIPPILLEDYLALKEESKKFPDYRG